MVFDDGVGWFFDGGFGLGMGTSFFSESREVLEFFDYWWKFFQEEVDVGFFSS